MFGGGFDEVDVEVVDNTLNMSFKGRKVSLKGKGRRRDTAGVPGCWGSCCAGVLDCRVVTRFYVPALNVVFGVWFVSPIVDAVRKKFV